MTGYRGDIALGMVSRRMAERGPLVKIRRRFRSSLQLLICRIDMTALAAVLFVLVTAFAAHPVAELTMDVPDPPKMSHATLMPGALREDVLLVAVTRDGIIWFDRYRTDPTRL